MWKVLVVEDDPMLAEIHKRYIDCQEDFECVDISLNAKAAFESIEKHDPDLILLDVYLPQTTGIEFLMKLREEGSTVDVILISAARTFEIIEKAFQFGAIDYLIKPFEFERLKKALDTFMQRKAMSESTGQIDQSKLDNIFLRQSDPVEMTLPKGLHERTYSRVKKYFEGFAGPVTIEQVAENLSMSKVTLRRYLEYLEKLGYVEIEMSYGTRGRPSYLYRRKGTV